MILRGHRVQLRGGLPEDAPRLLAILNEPEVQRWWGDFTVGEVNEQFIDSDSAFVIDLDGEVIGAIQCEEELDPMYRHAGIDVFVRASHHGRGLGTESVRVLAKYLITSRGHHRLTIDPRADNVTAIRAYKSVGFREVGVMRKYEQHPDGWHDGLFMELLAEDFIDAPADG
jgi:aminoglycoside 6'-N-acetyltransferase